MHFNVALMLASREFKIKYNSLKLGYLWVLLSPLAYTVLFILLKAQVFTNMQYAEFHVDKIFNIFIGVFIWQLWFDTLLQQMDSIRSHAQILRSIKISLFDIFLSKTIVSIYELLIRCVIILISLFFIRDKINISYIALPFVLFLTIYSANVIGFLLSVPSIIIGDIRKILVSFSFGLMVMSPVFYNATTNRHSLLYYVNLLNPFASGITVLRDIFFNTRMDYLFPFLLWSLLLVGINYMLLGFYKKIVPVIIERI